MQCDVLVIGGGVIGLAGAWELAKAGLKVALLERGLCGKESSWAGAGLLQCGSWQRRGPLARMLRDSLGMYEAFAAELLERSGIDPQLVRSGSLEVLLTQQQYQMAAAEVRAAGGSGGESGREVLELLSPEDLRRREPELTPGLLGARYCPLTCQVRSPRLLRALVAACTRAGVRLVEGCPARELVRQSGCVIGVETDDGRFTARWVVLAAGAWSSLLDPEIGHVVRVHPVRGQIVLLEAAGRPFSHIIERGRHYLVPRLDGRIVVGATLEPGAGFDKRNTAAGVADLLGVAQRLVPSLGQATLVQTWAGLRPGTPDRRPYIGPVPGTGGLLVATGHYRAGLTLAPLTARIITELITTGKTGYDLGRLSVESRINTQEV